MKSHMEKVTYQIGELAGRSGLTPDALRYYERLGLLPPARRTGGGFRVYPAAALERLRFIKQAQHLGLSLREIHDLLGYRDRGGVEECRRVAALLRAKLAELETRIAELQEFRLTLVGLQAECERQQAAGRDAHCPVIDTLEHRKS